ncbi:hypothetical protein ACOI22_03815 [Glaciecola sp. 2405UD65-10]|uniref:hypothetical protein n=1 Tax=Glaciecola sp. 2405UD65-10 TaxID=3397244 RepID=UPI003B5BAEFA
MRTKSLFLLIILLFNQCLASIANANQFTHAVNKVDDSVLVICTGSQVKYISSVDYFKFGKIVEVNSNLDTEQKPLCPVENTLQALDLVSEPYSLLCSYRTSLSLKSLSLPVKPYTFTPFNLATARAPPF